MPEVKLLIRFVRQAHKVSDFGTAFAKNGTVNAPVLAVEVQYGLRFSQLPNEEKALPVFAMLVLWWALIKGLPGAGDQSVAVGVYER